MQYYYEQESVLKSVNSGEIISENDRKMAHYVREEVLKNAVDKEIESGVRSATTEYPEIILTGKDYIETMYFGDNTGKTCGIIASSMLLTYYDKYMNTNFIPQELELVRHYDDRLHSKLLTDYRLNITLGGSVPNDEEMLLNFYLGQSDIRQNLGYQAKSSFISIDELIDSIDQGRPGILYTGFLGEYSLHAMLVYGYREKDGIRQIKAHTGWHDKENPRCADLNYICDHTNSPWVDCTVLGTGGATWLEKYKPHNHNFSSKLAPTLDQDVIKPRNLIKCLECNLLTEDDHTNSTISATEVVFNKAIEGIINQGISSLSL